MRMYEKRASDVFRPSAEGGKANRHCSNPAVGTPPPRPYTKSPCPASNLDAEIACERYSIGPGRMARGHRKIKGWRDGINVSAHTGVVCTNAGREQPERCTVVCCWAHT